MPTALRLFLAVLLLGPVLSACADAGSTGDKGYVDGRGVLTRLPVADRRAPGPVSGRTLEGRKVSLSDYRGRTVVLNVWGSWCPPCRKEAPTLAAAARVLRGDDVVFLGIDTRDSSPEQALAFQRRYRVPYPSLYDPAGRTLLAFRDTLTPNAIPSTVVVDPRGRVAASILGEVPGRSTLVDLVREVAR